MPIVASERLPKEAAGPGLRSTLLPRKVEEEETQQETAKIFRESRGPGRADEIGNSLEGPGRCRMGFESHGPGRAWAREFENITRWAGGGLGQAASARPGSTPPPRVGPTRKNRWIRNVRFLTI